MLEWKNQGHRYLKLKILSQSPSGGWAHRKSLTTSSQADKDAQARKSVRSNNFTQQTNALDVDKHMCVTSFVLSV